jgi:outer membrane protein assembly factor BamD (BamD/ComL family)
MKKNYLAVVLVTALAALLPAQDARDTRQRELAILEKNIDLYRTGKYEKAEQNFNLIINRIPSSVFITTNYLMWAKCKYKLQDYREVLKISRF